MHYHRFVPPAAVVSPAVLVLVLIIAIAPAARADIWFVRPDGQGTVATIQAAVDASRDGDEIWLDSGVFTGPGNRDIELRTRNVLIRSFAGDPAACIIDCGGSQATPHRAFRLADQAVQATVFRDLTLRNGWAAPGGGAVLIVGYAAARFENCVFEDNATGMTDFHGGGAVYVDRGGLQLFAGCTFRNNQGFAGGAVTTNHGGRCRFEACRFLTNTAVRGGALYGITSDKFDCLFAGNRADVGGAVWGNAVAVDYYERCTLDGNVAADGGAIYAMANYGGSVELIDCIVSNNGPGAGLQISSQVPITLSCCDVYGNAGGDWIAPFAAQVDERGNFGANPCYCDPGNGDYHLAADSYAAAGAHPWGCSQRVGAYAVGCGELGCGGPVPVETKPFGSVKSLYR